jgi:hypothetical protein
MRPSMHIRWKLARSAALLIALLGVLQGARAQDKQAILGPGLYVFQTRIRNSTCGDADKDGYVVTYLATIDGVPGAIDMTMELVNTEHFKNWQLKVAGKAVLGESRMGTGGDAPDSHFEVALDKDRFKGTGSRSYNGKGPDGKPQRCRVNYDALLRRLDDR